MHFVSETCKAALAWREVLTVLNAEVLATEGWLEGSLSGIPIHGKFDLLLGFTGEQLIGCRLQAFEFRKSPYPHE